MSKERFLRSFLLFISLFLLTSALSLSAIGRDIAINLPEREINTAVNNEDVSYVYLGKELSNIIQLIFKIKDLNEQDNRSLLSALKKNIAKGFSFVEYDAVLKALNYAQLVIQQNNKKLNGKCAKKIMTELDEIIDQVEQGLLTTNSRNIEITQDQSTKKHCGHNLRNLVVNENMDVLGKSTFCRHMLTKEGIHILGKLKVDKRARFKKDATFKENVIVEQTLTVTDLVVSSCIDSLCVNNLSVVDISVAGVLSVNDAFIENGTIQNLTITASVLDSVINNLTVNTMLSVNNEVINGNLKLTTLTPAGVVHNDASGNLSSSLIVNADIAASTITNNKLANISSNNVSGDIVVRDNSGNFSAGTITATLSGNATTATTAITATNFTGSLVGDVTGTQGATVVSFVGGQTAAAIAAATELANSGTDENTPNTLVKRNSMGGFSAGIVSVIDSIVSSNIILTTNPSSSTAGNIFKGTDVFVSNFGTNNTFIGINSGNFTLSGSDNIGFGVAVLNDCTSGSNNIVIGSDEVITTGSNNIYLGADAVINEFNVIRIGNAAVQCYIAGVNGASTGPGSGVLINANGQLGSTVSSRKFKHNITSMSDVSENIYKLNPVEFAYNNDVMEEMQFGLIAEEVETTFPALVVYDKNNQPYSVQYHLLPVLLLNEIKKQHKTIDNLTMTVENMNDVIDSLQGHIGECMKRIKAMEDQVEKDFNEIY